MLDSPIVFCDADKFVNPFFVDQRTDTVFNDLIAVCTDERVLPPRRNTGVLRLRRGISAVFYQLFAEQRHRLPFVIRKSDDQLRRLVVRDFLVAPATFDENGHIGVQPAQLRVRQIEQSDRTPAVRRAEYHVKLCRRIIGVRRYIGQMTEKFHIKSAIVARLCRQNSVKSAQLYPVRKAYGFVYSGLSREDMLERYSYTVRVKVEPYPACAASVNRAFSARVFKVHRISDTVQCHRHRKCELHAFFKIY